MLKKLSSLGWFLLALVTCPCHMIFVIPILSGTALGAFLMTENLIVRIILGIIFIVSLYLGISRLLDFFIKEKKKEEN